MLLILANLTFDPAFMLPNCTCAIHLVDNLGGHQGHEKTAAGIDAGGSDRPVMADCILEYTIGQKTSGLVSQSGDRWGWSDSIRVRWRGHH